MRILLVGTGVERIPPVGYGGVERTIAEYARALERAGHEAVIVNRVGRGRSVDEYVFAAGLARRLRGATYDVLHASTPVVANRLRFSALPYVYTTHSRHWFDCHGARERFGRFLERRAVAGALASVALTDRVAAALRGALRDRAGRIEVIPIGVDTDRFRPPSSPAPAGRALGVGVVRPFKRWEVAARALARAKIPLRIVGPTPDREYAARVRAAGPGVELVGELGDAELLEEYHRADFLVHPSRVELLAGVVLQALACGLPVVGADPVAPLLDPGEDGYAAPADASEPELERFLGERARALADDRELRARLSRGARRAAETRFAWPNVVERHVALYRALPSRR